MRMTAHETTVFLTGSREEKLSIVRKRFETVVALGLSRGDDLSARRVVREVGWLLRQAESSLRAVSEKLDDQDADDPNDAAEIAEGMRSLLSELPSWWADIVCAALATAARRPISRRGGDRHARGASACAPRRTAARSAAPRVGPQDWQKPSLLMRERNHRFSSPRGCHKACSERWPRRGDQALRKRETSEVAGLRLEAHRIHGRTGAGDAPRAPRTRRSRRRAPRKC